MSVASIFPACQDAQLARRFGCSPPVRALVREVASHLVEIGLHLREGNPYPTALSCGQPAQLQIHHGLSRHLVDLEECLKV